MESFLRKMSPITESFGRLSENGCYRPQDFHSASSGFRKWINPYSTVALAHMMRCAAISAAGVELVLEGQEIEDRQASVAVEVGG